MLSQYIEIQSSNVNHTSINQSMSLSHSRTLLDGPQINCASDDSSFSKKQTNQQNTSKNSILTKSKLKKLQELYRQGQDKLNQLQQQNQRQQKQQKQKKDVIQIQIRELIVNKNDKNRKGSQTSTAGEEEQMKLKIQDRSLQKRKNQSADRKYLLEEKLAQLRANSIRAHQEEQNTIKRLKNALMENHNDTNDSQEMQLIKISQSKQSLPLRIRLQLLQKQKQQLVQSISTTTSKANEKKLSIIHLSNSTQYFRSTQSCCQQILNEELSSIQHKLEGRRKQYDCNKRYLDKIIRSRKYEENRSFQDTKHQINHLNCLCEQMIANKKDFYGPEIKKYKKKRLHIIDQIKQVKDKFIHIQNQKILIETQIKQQNKLYDQLQDQYCLLLEKADLNNTGKIYQVSPQQKINLLKQNKQLLSQQLKSLLTQYSQIKSQIENDKSIVPQNIIKDFKKKIYNIKQDLHQTQILTKKNAQLQKQNKKLNQEKSKVQWKINPDIQKFTKEEKQLVAAQDKLKETLIILKNQNQILEDQIIKVKQAQKISKQNTLKQSNEQKADILKRQTEEQQRKKKQQDQKQLQNRSKIIEKFRQKNCQDLLLCQLTQKPKQRSKELKRNSGNKHRKGKQPQRAYTNRQSQEFEWQKGLGFFVRRENPLEILQSDFPLNRSQETQSNLSLLSSNPALYMLVIFFTVVIPGLCIGYKI